MKRLIFDIETTKLRIVGWWAPLGLLSYYPIERNIKKGIVKHHKEQYRNFNIFGKEATSRIEKIMKNLIHLIYCEHPGYLYKRQYKRHVFCSMSGGRFSNFNKNIIQTIGYNDVSETFRKIGDD